LNGKILENPVNSKPSKDFVWLKLGYNDASGIQTKKARQKAGQFNQ